MISIGNIGFNFRTEDEEFTRNMYVRWDDFYRDVIQEIIEGFFSRHDVEGELIRLDKLDLHLGDISQKDFYQQFPVRLREELERAFSYQSMQIGSKESEGERIQRRLASLMFYLEKGFCPTMWEEAEFNMEKEMQFLLLYAPHMLAHLFHNAVRQPGKLSRLIWSVPPDQLGRLMLLWVEEKSIPQDEKEMRLMELEKENYVLLPSLHKIADHIPALSEKLSVLLAEEKNEDYMFWLLSTTLSVYEKRRSLARLLDMKPAVVLRFIHETSDEKSIRSLAGLLDRVMVRQIIDTESENHTEVDVPDYWMYLYDWLIKNYPFNGVYMFGNKMQFKEYLNMKLLHFIRKRLYSAYLSKAELTVQFLIEVFGHEYYLEVLNIIYNQQERNADGTPVYTGYFNMELYYMFLRLSLIKLPVGEEGMREESVSADVSFCTTELLVKVAELLHLEGDRISWLSGVTADRLVHFIYIAMLRWMATQERSLIANVQETVGSFLLILYNEVYSKMNDRIVLSGSNREIEEATGRILRQLHLSNEMGWDRIEFASIGDGIGEFDALNEGVHGDTILQENVISSLLSLEWIGRLRSLLGNEAISISEKRRVVARLMEIFQDDSGRFVTTMNEHALLTDCIKVMNRLLLEQLLMRLVKEGNNQHGFYMMPFFRWILAHDTCLAAFFSGGVAELEERMIILLADWAVHGVARNMNAAETGRIFLTRLFGKENLIDASQSIFREMNRDFSLSAMPYQMYESEFLLKLLFQMVGSSILGGRPAASVYEMNESGHSADRSILLHQDFVKWLIQIDKYRNNSRLIIEKYLDRPSDFVAWVGRDVIGKDFKRKILQSYTAEHPYEFIGLLRKCANIPSCLSALAGIWRMVDILEFMSRVSAFKAEVLSQIIGILRQKPAFSSIIKVDGKKQEEVYIKALLLFLLDEKVSDRLTTRAEVIIRQWVFFLHLTYTGREVCHKSEESRWHQLEILLVKEWGTLSGQELQQLGEGQVTDEKWISTSVNKEDIVDWLNREHEMIELRHYLAIIMENNSNLLIDFLEKDTDQIMKDRLAVAMDHVLLKQLIVLVSASVDSSNTVFFSRLMTWIMQHLMGDSSDKVLFYTLVSWMQERGWRNYTQDEMRDFFFLHLQTVLSVQLTNTYCSSGISTTENSLPDAYGQNQSIPSTNDHNAEWATPSGEKKEPQGDIISPSEKTGIAEDHLPLDKEDRPEKTEIWIQEWSESVFVDWLREPGISARVKQCILHQYFLVKPGKMLSIVRKLVNENMVLVDGWISWFDVKDWIRMVAGISLVKAELLEQIITYLLEKQLVTIGFLQTVLIRFLTEKDPESWIREPANETVKRFVRSIESGGSDKEEDAMGQMYSVSGMVQRIAAELSISDTEQAFVEELSASAPDYIPVGNAGVVLLTPWFPRLFGMLGLLNEKQKDFKDMASRVRAIFIIQRLVTFEEKEYKEKELAFNRILVNCPFSEPLPVNMDLTEEELQAVESMLNGVKGNWTKVRNISIKGFQYNFIERSGQLEQKEEKWVLSVDPRSYDMLLDSVPWSYTKVRFPWLKKQIHVSWRTKEEF